MPKANFFRSISIEELRDLQSRAIDFQHGIMADDSLEMALRVRAAESVLRHSKALIADLKADEPDDDRARQTELFDGDKVQRLRSFMLGGEVAPEASP